MNTQHTASPLPMPSRHRRTQRAGTHEQVTSIKYSEQYFFIVVLLDLLFLNTAIVGSLSFQTPLSELTAQSPQAVWLLVLTANVLAVFVAATTEVFRGFAGIRVELKHRELLKSSVIYFGILGLIYYQFFFPALQVHFLIPAFCVFLPSAALVHYLLTGIYRRSTRFLTYAVVGGDRSGFRFVEAAIASAYGRRTLCVGRFADDHLSEVQTLGGYGELKKMLQQGIHVDKILYFDSNLSKKEVREIIQVCRSKFVDFEVIPQAFHYFTTGLHIEQWPQLPVLQGRKEPLYSLRNKVFKRAFDIVFSLAVILLVFPWLFPIIALLIKLESRGPVLFMQKRTGYLNKPFNCLKFRSMRVNGQCDQQQAVKADARITRIGAFLRKSSLDEFPQFLNVLMGHMSVVGPRPHMLKHTEEYSQLIDAFMIRHAVKPGITGWAQVNGWRGPTPEVYQMAKRVEYDLAYIENWSFWLDCKCIYLTVINIFKGDKNAF